VSRGVAAPGVGGLGYNVAVAGPRRDDFPNNYVGDLVHDERGWVVVMRWNEMWLSGTYFDLACAFDPVRQPAERYRRLGEESVVCFTLADEHWAAIGYQGAYTGFKHRLWFTTLNLAARKGEKLRTSYGQWAEIMHNAQEVHVVTSWQPLIPDGAKTRKRGWGTR
jgi:hypothetical protein